jgi:hypothetical protein
MMTPGNSGVHLCSIDVVMSRLVLRTGAGRLTAMSVPHVHPIAFRFSFLTFSIFAELAMILELAAVPKLTG